MYADRRSLRIGCCGWPDS